MKPSSKNWKSTFVLSALVMMFLSVMLTSIVGLLVAEKIKFQATLISLPITISIFAVNFSFLGYQFSPYRSILKRISESHILRSGILLVISLFPLVTYFSFDDRVTIIVIAAIIPTTLLGGIFLLYTSLQEIDPLNILNKVASEKAVNKFYFEFGTQIHELQNEIEGWQLSSPIDQPKHEWDSHFDPPSPESDPLELAVNLISIAVQNSDMPHFVVILSKAMSIVEAAFSFDGKIFGEKGYKVTSRVQRNVSYGLRRIARICLDLDKSGAFCDRLNQNILFEIKKLASQSKQTTDYCLTLTSVAFYLCDSLLREKKRTAEATAFISAIRQVAQKGVDAPPESQDDHEYVTIMFGHTLTSYPSYIKGIGVSAIEAKDAGFLYKCTEALCWLGCSAVKKGNKEIMRECLQGLSYLGRLSKHYKLTCFWSRCALDPVDHASENLWSMLSWLPKVTDDYIQKEMLRSFEEAYSRIEGVTYKIELAGETDKGTKIKIQRTEEPHKVEHFTSNSAGMGHARTIDFSDFTMIKDHNLH